MMLFTFENKKHAISLELIYTTKSINVLGPDEYLECMLSITCKNKQCFRQHIDVWTNSGTVVA